MKFRMLAGLSGVALLLAACSQENAPSEKVEEVSQDLVDAAQGEAAGEEVALGAYAPRDDCSDLEGADVFLQRLALAVEARDAEGVAVLAAEDVKLDFGGGAGRAKLTAMLEDPDASMWQQLEELGNLGCAKNSQGGITLPWYFGQDIPIDGFSAMIVTGDEVPLLASQSKDAEVVARLNWDAVEILGGYTPDKPLQEVRFRDKEGFIATNKLRSVLDYRLSASSRNDRWRITSLIAGD